MPLLSLGAGPDHDRTAGAGDLVGAGLPQTQWWAAGSAPAAVGLNPPTQPLGKTFLGSKVLTAAAPHGDLCPAAWPRPCLFVLGRQRHSCLLFTPCPGGMWMPGLTASPGTGRRSTQPSLGTAAPGATSVSHLSWGWGGRLTGAPIRGPHSELVDTGLRPTLPLHLAGPGVPKCPQRDCPSGSSPQGTRHPAAESNAQQVLE